MEQILSLVAEVENKAVAILELAKEEKQRLKEEEQNKRLEFEALERNNYQTEIEKYENVLEEHMKEEVKYMELQLDENKKKMQTYIDRKQEELVKQFIKQVIGARSYVRKFTFL